MSTEPKKADEMRQLSILAEIYFTLFEKFKIDADNPDENRLSGLKETRIGYFMNGIFDTLVTQSREQAFIKLKALKNLQDKWNEDIPGPFTLPPKFQLEKYLNGKRSFAMLGENQSADENSQLGTSPTLTDESSVKKLKTEQTGQGYDSNEGSNVETRNGATTLKSEALNFQGYIPPKYVIDIYKLYLPISAYASLSSQKRSTSRMFCESLFLKHSVASKAIEEEKNKGSPQKMLEAEEVEDLVEKIETEEHMNGLLSDEAVQQLNQVLAEKIDGESPDSLAQALGLSPNRNNDIEVQTLLGKEDKIMEIEMKEKKPSLLDIEQRSKLSSKKSSRDKSQTKELKVDVKERSISNEEVLKSEVMTADNDPKPQVNKEDDRQIQTEKINFEQHLLNNDPKEASPKESQTEEKVLTTEKVTVAQLSLQQNLIDMRKNIVLKNEEKPLLETSGVPEVGKGSSNLSQIQGPNISNRKNQTNLKASALFSELLQRKADSKIKFDSAKLLKLLQQEQEKQKSGAAASGSLKPS